MMLLRSQSISYFNVKRTIKPDSTINVKIKHIVTVQ